MISSLLLIAAMTGFTKTAADEFDTAGADEAGFCPLRLCCEEDCCGLGTSWQSPTCLPDPYSGGFNGTYSPDYVWGCELRKCCDSECCGAGTQFYEDSQRCLVTSPSASPSTSLAPFLAPPIAPGTPTPPPTPAPTPCPLKIRIKQFCIQGDPGDEYGSTDLEVKLRLQNSLQYYPNNGFVDVDFNTCLTLNDPAFRNIERHESIIVGFEENDDFANDFAVQVVPPSKWCRKDCQTYEVYIYKEFSPPNKVTTCYDLGGSVQVPGTPVDVNGSFKQCSEVTEPAEYYLWIIEVTPR